jgi:hypothetical protein
MRSGRSSEPGWQCFCKYRVLQTQFTLRGGSSLPCWHDLAHPPLPACLPRLRRLPRPPAGPGRMMRAPTAILQRCLAGTAATGCCPCTRSRSTAGGCRGRQASGAWQLRRAAAMQACFAGRLQGTIVLYRQLSALPPSLLELRAPPACSMLEDALRTPPPPDELLGSRETV